MTGLVSSPEPGVIEIRGGRARPTLTAVTELIEHRDVHNAFVIRTLKTRYRQSIGGFAWIMAAPLASALMYSFFMGHLAKVSSNGQPYVLFSLIGTVLWGIFARGGIGGIDSVVSEGAFVRKIYFPRVILPISNLTQSLADVGPALVVMLGLALWYDKTPSPSWLLIVVPMLIVAMTALGFSMAFSVINVYYRDVRQASPLFSQLGLFGSAIIYPLSAVPEDYRTAFAIVNPIAGSVDGARRLILEGKGLDVPITLGGFAVASLMMVVGYAFFSSLERDVADRI